MDFEHARQQLDTLAHLRRRVHRRLNRPALLLFALGVFLALALKHFGERTEFLSVAILLGTYQSGNQGAAPRRMPWGSTLLLLIALLLWVLLCITFGNWNPFDWTYVWPLAGLCAAAPIMLMAWAQRP
ncbi:hypothetical protein [Deinococcus apachensis]|uniref:hypothetical protein n=1 Tax=Deinococcus apachensis TaxID=309886 RepID=UPI00037ACD6B|nr:hypothetical protein [Deinococcus apachensis]